MAYLSKLPKKTRNRLILSFFSCIAIVIWWLVYPQVVRSLSGENSLVVRFYDVGQGDAALIQYRDTKILVDGGPDEWVLSHLGRDLLPWDREIDLLILTHPQADHLTGLLRVLERYDVKSILYYPSVYDTKGYQQFIDLIDKEGARIMVAAAGEKLVVGPILLQILWPTDNYHDRNVNNESVVLLLEYQSFDVLFLGDAESPTQKNIYVNKDIEVIKMAHHGAESGMYLPLLQTAVPDLAIISAGLNNRFGHPHKKTLSVLDKLGISYLRTDLNGTITIGSDGENFWYDTDR